MTVPVERDLAAVLAAPAGSTPATRRTATVLTVNTDGTLDVTWPDGTTITSLPRLGDVPAVGDEVILLGTGDAASDFVVVGPVTSRTSRLGNGAVYQQFDQTRAAAMTTSWQYLGGTPGCTFKKWNVGTRLRTRLQMSAYADDTAFIFAVYINGETSLGDDPLCTMWILSAGHTAVNGETIMSVTNLAPGTYTANVAVRTVTGSHNLNTNVNDSCSIGVDEIW